MRSNGFFQMRQVCPTCQGERERIVVNMGPQHPSTHGVLRLILELEGETVKEARAAIGYLHTGIEKNMEYRTFSQGPTFVTRMDYLTSFFNEAAYVMSVERLLGIEIPERAKVIRVMMMELNRVNSHLVCLGTGGMELGALTAMTNGFRDRELLLDLFEGITGLRMNHNFIRPGGLAADLPARADALRRILDHRHAGREALDLLQRRDLAEQVDRDDRLGPRRNFPLGIV